MQKSCGGKAAYLNCSARYPLFLSVGYNSRGSSSKWIARHRWEVNEKALTGWIVGLCGAVLWRRKEARVAKPRQRWDLWLTKARFSLELWCLWEPVIYSLYSNYPPPPHPMYLERRGTLHTVRIGATWKRSHGFTAPCANGKMFPWQQIAGNEVLFSVVMGASWKKK